MAVPIPKNEPVRLKTLKRYNILDTTRRLVNKKFFLLTKSASFTFSQFPFNLLKLPEKQ